MAFLGGMLQEGNARIPLLVFLCCVVLSEGAAFNFLVDTLTQYSACAGEGNVITLDLELDTRLMLSDNPTATITGLVSTFTDDTAAFPIVDHAKIFSDIAVLAADLAVDDEDTMYLDNSYLAGLSVGDTVRIEGEYLAITNLTGVGCNRSSHVHDGCWSAVSVVRAQVGSVAVPHAAGALVYKVVAGRLMDYLPTGSGFGGVDTQQTFLNLDRVDGFSNATASGSPCYCQVDNEAMLVQQVVLVNGQVACPFGRHLTAAFFDRARRSPPERLGPAVGPGIF